MRRVLIRARPALAVLAFVATADLASAARAQDEECDPVVYSPTESFPASGAQDVPVNARLEVRYPADYFTLTGAELASTVRISRVDVEDDVPGDYELVTGAGFDAVFFFPDAELIPGARYRIEALGFDGDLIAEFRVVDDLDLAEPQLGSIDVASAEAFDGCDASDPCCATPDGYRVDVEFSPATDDGALGSIEYLLYQTRGPDLAAPRLVDRVRNFSTSTISMAFLVSAEEASGSLCLVAFAVDGQGNLDDDMEPYCFEPIVGNYFEPICAAGGSGPRRLPVGALGFALMLLALRRRGSSLRSRPGQPSAPA